MVVYDLSGREIFFQAPRNCAVDTTQKAKRADSAMETALQTDQGEGLVAAL